MKTLMLTRRRFLTTAGTVMAGGTVGYSLVGRSEKGAQDTLGRVLVQIEGKLDARLGVAIRDTQTGRYWTHRANERFPLCSTFKAIACGAVLAQVDAGQDRLSRHIRFDVDDVVPYSPVTERRAGGKGMTLRQLCRAALTRSDNTAGNLILKSIGGPSAVTAFARSLGDRRTRLDRWETDLNEAVPGDPRDTTTPAAMAISLRSLVLGDALSQPSREQLAMWLVANKTGDAKLRAGLPESWRIGDKTGGGGYGTTNDVAVLWPPRRKALIASIYITETEASFDDRNAAIAEIGSALRRSLDA